MERLPSKIMLDVFSRLPGRCLARSRCVSKVWCKYIDNRYLTMVYDDRVTHEPIPILYHNHVERNRINLVKSLCFHKISESKQAETGTTKDPFLEFLPKEPLQKSSYVRINVRGSCNGLMCLSQIGDGTATTLFVVHPLRKECYELPPLPICRDASGYRKREESCGLGCDASTNTLKMVYVKENLCTMVHVFGTDSWREIPQVPLYPIGGNFVFVNGRLHWLATDTDIDAEDGGRPVIWFDVEKEEFGMIDPPKQRRDKHKSSSFWGHDHLVDLNGEVGYVCFTTLGVWVLKQKEWVPHWRFRIVPNGCLEVLGCWNKDGDILVRNYIDGEHKFLVYNLKSGILHKTGLVFFFRPWDANIFLHPNKLFSIQSIGKNSFRMDKTGVKESCQQLFSYH